MFYLPQSISIPPLKKESEVENQQSKTLASELSESDSALIAVNGKLPIDFSGRWIRLPLIDSLMPQYPVISDRILHNQISQSNLISLQKASVKKQGAIFASHFSQFRMLRSADRLQKVISGSQISFKML